MSQKHKLLTEAILAFSPKFTIARPGNPNPLPAEATLENVIEEMVGLMINGKALSAPRTITVEGEFKNHSLCLMDQPEPGMQAGKIIFEVTIYTDVNARSGALESTFIAHGIISIAANAALVVIDAQNKAATAAAAKKEEAAAPAVPEASNAPASVPGTEGIAGVGSSDSAQG